MNTNCQLTCWLFLLVYYGKATETSTSSSSTTFVLEREYRDLFRGEDNAYQIGGVLSNNESVIKFKNMIAVSRLRLLYFYSSLPLGC